MEGLFVYRDTRLERTMEIWQSDNNIGRSMSYLIYGKNCTFQSIGKNSGNSLFNIWKKITSYARNDDRVQVLKTLQRIFELFTEVENIGAVWTHSQSQRFISRLRDGISPARASPALFCNIINMVKVYGYRAMDFILWI